MYCFYSFDDMLRQYEKEGWSRIDTRYGFRLIPSQEIATGSIEIRGNTMTHCYVDSNVVFHKDLMERYYFKERGIQISFVDDMSASYYQNKNEIASAGFGVYVYINNMPRPWFKRFPAERIQKVSSFLVMESFLKSANIHLSDDIWDEAAIAINNNNLSFPKIGLICKQIKTVDVSEEMFPLYFEGKTIEVVSLLFDHVITRRQNRKNDLMVKSREAAREAIRILNREFVYPPDVESLSAMVGIDKKTLQKAFRQITGSTVGEYIRSIRMEKALTLLEEENLSIEEISGRVGYFSKINFYKAFRRIFDCTPREIKRSL